MNDGFSGRGGYLGGRRLSGPNEPMIPAARPPVDAGQEVAGEGPSGEAESDIGHAVPEAIPDTEPGPDPGAGAEAPPDDDATAALEEDADADAGAGEWPEDEDAGDVLSDEPGPTDGTDTLPTPSDGQSVQAAGDMGEEDDTSPTGHGSKMRRMMDQAIAALLSQRSIAGAAKKIGVSENTLAAWMRSPVFDRAYRMARRSVSQPAFDQLARSVPMAVQTLISVMGDKDAPATARLAAARMVLETQLKVAEAEKMADRLAAVEDFVRERIQWD